MRRLNGPPMTRRDNAAYLARLIEVGLAETADCSVNVRIARARFPVMRTLEEFDFYAHAGGVRLHLPAGLSAVRVRELANLAFLDHVTNVLFIGGPGVGKTPGHQLGSESLPRQTQRAVQLRRGLAR